MTIKHDEIDVPLEAKAHSFQQAIDFGSWPIASVDAVYLHVGS